MSGMHQATPHQSDKDKAPVGQEPLCKTPRMTENVSVRLVQAAILYEKQL